MKILGVYNIKGGVGKTTTAVNLAAVAASLGGRILVWDLDPQGAASFYFRVEAKIKGGRKSLFKRRSDIDSLIKGTDYPCLDLLPSDFSYRKLDLALDQEKKSLRRLSDALSALKGNYDFVLIDCPPGISKLSEAVFQLTDTLLVPVIPTTLSVRTLEQVLTFLAKQPYRPPAIHPLFNLLDRRKTLHRQITERLWSEIPSFLKTPIANSSTIERMGVHCAPVIGFAPTSEAARAYQELWFEVQERVLGLAPPPG